MRAELHLATFSCEVTPPVGHPLCGGWIEPVRGVDDPLRAHGRRPARRRRRPSCCVPSTGAACATRRTWPGGEALAKAAHTTADRVAVQCVHPHNAPFADIEAQKLLERRQRAAPRST